MQLQFRGRVRQQTRDENGGVSSCSPVALVSECIAALLRPRYATTDRSERESTPLYVLPLLVAHSAKTRLILRVFFCVHYFDTIMLVML